MFNNPVAGYRNNSTGALTNVGSNGNYWSSTVSGTNARNLNFNSSNANMNSNNRANGFSVRCIKEKIILPCLFKNEKKMKSAQLCYPVKISRRSKNTSICLFHCKGTHVNK